MKEQEIGEMFKSKLTGHEVKPQPSVWEGIAKAPAVKRFNRGRQFRYWGLRAGIPALFTAAVITAVLLLRPAQPTEETSPLSSRSSDPTISNTGIVQQTTDPSIVSVPSTPSVSAPVSSTQPSTKQESEPTEATLITDNIQAETPVTPSPTTPQAPATVPQTKSLPSNGGNEKPDNPPIPNNPQPEVAQVSDHPSHTTKEDFSLIYSHDTLVCRNSKLTLFVKNADHVFWSFGSDLESVDLIVEENTRVEATVHTKDGKDTLIRVNITVCDCELFIPTAFTPNGDGLNDEWIVYAPAGITDFECMVYDKAGTLLFHTRSIHQGWNGMNNGKYLPAGGYFYSCRYRDELGTPHVQKGQVTLVR